MMFDKRLCLIALVILLYVFNTDTQVYSRDVAGVNLRQKRGSEGGCPRGRYMDKGTGHCDPCTPHCHRTSVNPPSGCQTFCKQMTDTVGQRKTENDTTRNETRCSDGYYYDKGTLNCDLCLPYCTSHLEDPPADCLSFCNKQPVAIIRPPEQIKTAKQGSSINPRSLGLSIGLCVLVILVAIIGLVTFRRKRCRKRPNNENNNDEQRVPFRPSIAEQTQDGERTSELVTNTANSAV